MNAGTFPMTETQKHAATVLLTYVVMVPFVLPLLQIEDAPISPMVWLLVILSAAANVVVMFYHWLVPAHPKFVMVPWRRFVLGIHIVSGTVELIAGLLAIFGGSVSAAIVMAVVGAFVHAPSAYIQTQVVFGSRAIIRPGYLACIGLHVLCALMLLANPTSLWWAVSTFLVFNTYVWCRVYYFVFDKWNVFAGAKYSVAILAAGITAITPVLGEATMLTLFAAVLGYVLAYSYFFIETRAEFVDFVRERARDSIGSEGRRALWNSTHRVARDKLIARRYFNHLDRDGSGTIGAPDLSEVAQMDATVAGIIGALGSETLDFDGFLDRLWNSAAVRERGYAFMATSGRRSERDKAEFAFEQLDSNGDGFVDRDELRDLLDEWALPEHEVDSYLDRVDKDRDGQIRFDEFFVGMRPVWRFIYYDVIEARHGAREDMIRRAFTQHADDAELVGLKADIRRVLVGRVPFLSGLAPEILDELSSSFVREKRDADEVLFSVGEQGDAFYLVQSGEVRIHLGGETIAVLGPGAYFGEGALLSNPTRGASATMVEGGTLLVLSAESFAYLLERHPSMAEEVKSTDLGRRLSNMKLALQHQLLADTPFLAQADGTTLTRLSEVLMRQVRESGQVLFRAGDEGDAMYLVSAGVLQVLHEGQVVAEHGPGSWVGEGAILTGEPRSADVVVSEAAVLYRLGVDDFRAVVETLDGFQNTLQALHERRKVALEAVSGR